MELDDYISAHIDAEPPELAALYRHTHLTRLYPRMCSDHAQGRLLAMLTRMIAPKRIVELGTFTGYSTLSMAGAMPCDCHIDTIEVDSDYADELSATLAASPRGSDITLHIGDAEEVLPTLLSRGATFDMAFIDANKRRYCRYYRLLVDAMPSGSYIIADNTLWSDKVLADTAADAQTEGIRQFNDLVAADTRVEKVIIPVRDGLTIIRKR